MLRRTFSFIASHLGVSSFLLATLRLTRLGNHIVRDLSGPGLPCQGLGAAASLEVLARAQWVSLMLNRALSAHPSCLLPPGAAESFGQGASEKKLATSLTVAESI